MLIDGILRSFTLFDNSQQDIIKSGLTKRIIFCISNEVNFVEIGTIIIPNSKQAIIISTYSIPLGKKIITFRAKFF